MSFSLGILTFIVVLAVLILVHELGHFTMAKLFGVRVEEFGLGFPPRLRTWRRHGTLYSLNAIPVGGFVKMSGENGETDDPASFGAKPPWQRFIILVAGPSMNLLLALAVFFFTFLLGFPDGLTRITGVAGGSPAASHGLRAGDEILRVDGKRVRYRSELSAAILDAVAQRPHTAVSLLVQRGSRDFTTTLVPRVHPPANQGAVGITLADDTVVKYGALRAVGKSVTSVGDMVATLPVILTTVSHSGTRDIAGPIGIAHLTTQTVSAAPRDGPSPLLYLIALLSANLGVLNLLPIPALDGGRVMFVLLSWIRRRNLDPEVEGMIHLAGMAVLLILILVISYQDLAHWITGSY